MPVVPAAIEGLEPDRLTVRWDEDAPLENVEGFLAYLLESDGLTAPSGAVGPRLKAEIGPDFCRLKPNPDLWSMILAEEMAIRLARCQGGEILDDQGVLLASVETEESQPWASLEAVGVVSLFRPRPPDSPDLHAHPLIPLEDCKISGFSFNEEHECVLDLYFDYWARPCAFLVEQGKPSILLYRPMYRYRQAIFGASDHCRITIKGQPTSRIYGALGVRGYKINQHKVDRRHNWTLKGQDGRFVLQTRTSEAWLTRSLPLWCQGDPFLLPFAGETEAITPNLLQRKEQHWDIVDNVWGQEWYVAAHDDGRLNPFGRIYSADPTTALLDLPALTPMFE